MNYFKTAASISILSIALFGCGTDNRNADQFTSNDNNEPLGVRYNPQDNLNDGQPNRLSTPDPNNPAGNGAGGNNANRQTGQNGMLGGDFSGGNAGNNTNNDRNQDRMDAGDKAADQVAKMKGVDSAHVIVMNRSAYVAVKMDGSSKQNVSDDLKKQISSKVKSTDKEIDKVYVSENPDFFNRMGQYRDDLKNGRPVSGLLDEFTTMVERIFPTNPAR